MWKIPLFKTGFNKKEEEAMRRVIKSGWLSIGRMTENFELRFAKFLGIKHAIALSSCTAALHLANLALGIGEGDEVICPALTFVAGPNSILYTGARPVFADIKGTEDFNISAEDIAKKINKKTKAIQVLHYGGFPCDMDRIIDMAKRYSLKVIEDCAHAVGSRYGKKRCGAIGDVGCFSFYTNKNMTTGEGGMAVTDNDEMAQRIRFMRSHGMTSTTLDRYKGHAFNYDVVEMGYNYRIDDMRSAIGIAQLEKLGRNNARRRELVELYRQRLDGINGINVPFSKDSNLSSNHLFAVLLDRDTERSAFMIYMKEKGIQTSIHYPAIHLFDLYRRRLGYSENALPIAEDVAKREVTLPLYPSMKKRDVNYVCDIVSRFFKKRG